MTCGGADLGRGGKSAEKPPTQHRGQHDGQDTHKHSNLQYETNLQKAMDRQTKCITDMLKM